MNERDGLIASEFVLTRTPFTVRRVVDWAECDPAGVVYAGNFTEYLFSAARLFRAHGLGEALNVPADGRPYDTPGKAVSLVFLGPLWPGDIFDMRVYAGTPRTSTFDTFVHAVRADDQSPVFVGRTTAIFVSAEDRRKTVPVADHFRAAIESYRATTPDFPEILRQVDR